MTGSRLNGVDATIALLLALIEHGGVARTADLARDTGLARASLHRIAKVLAAEGLLELSRGLIRVGPAAAGLLGTRNENFTPAAPQRRQNGTRLAAQNPAGSDTATPLLLSPPQPHRQTRRFRIGFSNASMDNPWRTALVHSVEHAAAHIGNGIEWLAVRHADDDARRQVKDIDALLALGVDGLIVSAADQRVVGDAITRAMTGGVAVVLVDRGVGPGIPHTSFVTTDDALIGRLTARWLAETLGGEGAVLMLPGTAGAEPAQRRLAAAQDVLTEYPDIDILGVEWTGWRRERGRAIVADAITRWGRRLAGIWCDSGLQGVGSLEAFVDAGWQPGEIPPHTGGDLNLAYKLAIRHRVPLAAVDYPPAMGIRALEILYASLCGHWVPAVVEVPTEIILTRGSATRSIRPDLLAEEHVRWDLPDDLVLASGLGPAYNPRSFRVRYPGNVYNRSAAPRRQKVSS